METLPKLAMFAPGQLDDLILDGVGSGSADEWVEKMLKTFAGIVKKTPRAYLSFGPMWWNIKAMLQDRGFLEGEQVDPARIAQSEQGSPALDIAAAFAFHDTYTSGNAFMCDTADGDTFEYQLVDEDMEAATR